MEEKETREVGRTITRKAVKGACKMWKKVRWRYKLPIIIGVIYFLISLPFIFGLLTPSIHEGNLYSLIHIIINILPLFLLGKLADSVSHLFFEYPTLYQSNMISIFCHYYFGFRSYFFWELLLI